MYIALCRHRRLDRSLTLIGAHSEFRRLYLRNNVCLHGGDDLIIQRTPSICSVCGRARTKYLSPSGMRDAVWRRSEFRPASKMLEDITVFLLCADSPFSPLHRIPSSVRPASRVVCLESHFLSAIISATAIARQLRFFPSWSKGQEATKWIFIRKSIHREKEEERTRYTNSKYHVAFNSTSPSFHSILCSNGANIYPALEWEGNPQYARVGNRCFQFQREIWERSRAVGIKWKKSNRVEMPPRRRFSFRPPYLFCVSNGIPFEEIPPTGRAADFPRIDLSRIIQQNAIKRTPLRFKNFICPVDQ